MTFNSADIKTRITLYRRCYANAAYDRMKSAAIGDQAAVDVYSDRILTLDFALRVLCTYLQDGQECVDQIASTYEEVCCAIKLADPCCPGSHCENEPVDLCAVTPTLFVDGATTPASRPSIEAGPPQDGDQWLVISGPFDSVWTQTGIYEWSEANSSWSLLNLAPGSVVDVQGVNWILYPGGAPGMLWPGITLTLVGAPGLYLAQSLFPYVALNANRSALIQRFYNGQWQNIWSGQEADLVDGIELNFDGVDLSTIRGLYVSGNCQWPAQAAPVIPPLDTCGIVNATVVSVYDCESLTYTVVVNIISVVGFPLDKIIYALDGVIQPSQQASIGTTILGPFDFGQIVDYVGITNAEDSDCDYSYGPFSGAYTPPGNNHPAPTLRQNLEAPYWTIEAQPQDPGVQSSMAVAEAFNGTDWVVIFSGQASLLLTPYDLGVLSFIPQQVRVTYYDTSCPVIVEGSLFFAEDEELETACDEPLQYIRMRYIEGTQAFLLTNSSPGETVSVGFIQGEMDPAVTINIYDGDSNLSPLLQSISGVPSFSQIYINGTTNQLYVEVNSTAAMADDMDTWIIQFGCTSGSLPPQGSATPVTDCDSFSWALGGSVLDVGDAATVTLRIIVNGGSPQDTPGLTNGSLISAGPFAFGDIVQVFLLHPDNQLSNLMIGEFVVFNDGDEPCTDPCAPEATFKIDAWGDSADIPNPPPTAAYVYLVLTSSDPNLIGTVLTWDDLTETYTTENPQSGTFIGSDPNYWITQGTGVQPLNAFPPGILVPLNPPSGGNNWRFSLANFSSLNREISLRVRNFAGAWVEVWAGTENEVNGVIDPYVDISIAFGFSDEQLVWNYGTCGYIGAVNPPDAQSGGGAPPDPDVPTEAVIFNDDDPASAAIGNLYLQIRPNALEVHVNLGNNDQLTNQSVYDAAKLIINAIPASVTDLALCFSKPSRIGPATGGTTANDKHCSINFGLTHAFGWSGQNMLAPWDASARVAGFIPTIEFLNLSAQNDQDGQSGTLYAISCRDALSQGNPRGNTVRLMWEGLPPNQYSQPHNWFSNLPDGSPGNNYLRNKPDMISYFTGLGAPILDILTNNIRRGAVADNVTSFGGRIGNHNGQESVLTFIAAGFVYVSGTVAEPYQSASGNSPGSLVEQFTDARLFIPPWLQGQRLAACYRAAVRRPVRNLGVFAPFTRYT